MWDLSPRGAIFLGKTTPLGSNQQNTPILDFGPGWEKLFIYVLINGYTSGGDIARLQFGTTLGSVDTGNNYSVCTSRLIAGGTTVGTTTSRTSQAGIEVANVATTNGRRGLHEVWNPVGDPKFCDSRTLTYTSQNPAAATAAHASIDYTCGNWWQNSEAVCVRLNAGSAGNSILTGSFISVSGIPRE